MQKQKKGNQALTKEFQILYKLGLEDYEIEYLRHIREKETLEAHWEH